MNKNILLAALFGFLGGIISNIILISSPVIAAALQNTLYQLQILDSNENKKLMELSSHNGSPMQNFYDSAGNMRIQFGVYNSGAEKGQPLGGLFDNKGNVRFLWRLAGSTDSPVLVIKDSNHIDRIVMGLSMDGKEEPFLSYVDGKGEKHAVFGNY